MQKTLIRSGRPSMEGLIVLQDDKIFVYADLPPRSYDWKLEHATVEEKDYLLRCMIENKWLDV